MHKRVAQVPTSRDLGIFVLITNRRQHTTDEIKLIALPLAVHAHTE